MSNIIEIILDADFTNTQLATKLKLKRKPLSLDGLEKVISPHFNYQVSADAKALLLNAAKVADDADLKKILQKISLLHHSIQLEVPLELAYHPRVKALISSWKAPKTSSLSIQSVFTLSTFLSHGNTPWGIGERLIRLLSKGLKIDQTLITPQLMQTCLKFDESIEKTSPFTKFILNTFDKQAPRLETEPELVKSVFITEILKEIKKQSDWLKLLFPSNSDKISSAVAILNALKHTESEDFNEVLEALSSQFSVSLSNLITGTLSSTELRSLFKEQSQLANLPLKHIPVYTQALYEAFCANEISINPEKLKGYFLNIVEGLGFGSKRVKAAIQQEFKKTTKFHSYDAILKKTLKVAMPLVEGIKEVEYASQPDYYKIGLIFETAKQLVKRAVFFDSKNSTTIEDLFPCLDIRGWYDLARALPVWGQWRLMTFRADSQEPSVAQFFKGSFSQSIAFSPYDARGGFSFNTFAQLCEYVGVDWKNQKLEAGASYFENYKSSAQAAASLVYLYGTDLDTIKKLIISNKSGRAKSPTKKTLRTAMLKLLDFEINPLPAEAIKEWRPILIKNKALLKFSKLIQPQDRPFGRSEEDLLKVLVTRVYKDVPAEMGQHMVHAFENNWTDKTVAEFIKLSKSAKTSCQIPQVDFSHKDVRVTQLKPGDLRALYVGELSGCCQHINDGYAKSVAIQSFTQDWCSVLCIFSKTSDKLLAQALIWLGRDKSSVVIDSLESIHTANSQVIVDQCLPAIGEWISKMNELNFDVFASSATCGVTQKLATYVRKTYKAKLAPVPRPFKTLSYSDAQGMNGLKISKDSL